MAAFKRIIFLNLLITTKNYNEIIHHNLNNQMNTNIIVTLMMKIMETLEKYHSHQIDVIINHFTFLENAKNC